MRILLSGSSGFVGSALHSHFAKNGDEVVPLVRKRLSSPCVLWDSPAQAFSGFDAVVHLSGEPIVGRWTKKKKDRLWSSRVDSTRKLSQILSITLQPPKVFLCASAIGFYGDRGESLLTEESSPGNGFLPTLCAAWEKAAQVPNIRCVQTRFGIVVGNGGPLQKMLLPYKLGLGGKLGSGKQWVSWVALTDLVRAIDFALRTETLKGPVNVVSPDALRQSEWAKILGSALHRPSFFSMPEWLVELLLGQMGRELLLSSARVTPQKLWLSGFHFSSPTFQQTLQKVLSTLHFKERL